MSAPGGQGPYSFAAGNSAWRTHVVEGMDVKPHAEHPTCKILFSPYHSLTSWRRPWVSGSESVLGPTAGGGWGGGVELVSGRTGLSPLPVAKGALPFPLSHKSHMQLIPEQRLGAQALKADLARH